MRLARMLRQKYALFLLVASFIVFSIIAIGYLPELRSSHRIIPQPKRDFQGPNLQQGPLDGGKSVIAPPIDPAAADKLLADASAAVQYSNHRNISYHPTGPYPLGSGDPGDAETRHRRDFVRNMMRHAYSSYEKYAFGANELRPISKTGHTAGIFGNTHMGATIIDSLDTLYMMNLREEFGRAKEWVQQNVDLSNIDSEMSVFETNIRYIGGLLTSYALSGEKMFLDKAKDIADIMLQAFVHSNGLPNALLNPKTGRSRNYAWASSSSAILSEVGSFHLEFAYLSDMTGDLKYKEKAFKIRNLIDSLEKPDGLYPNYINPKTGNWGQRHVSIGALGDSFYEYLLKAYIQSGRRDTQALRMYNEAIEAVEKALVQHSDQSNLLYVAEMKYGHLEHKMDHLACFAGGMFALGGKMTLGAELTHTCHESYDRTSTKIGPDSFRFTSEIEARAVRPNEKYFLQRPEVVESYFYLWRLTHDQKYRDWAWEAAQAYETYCRVDGGYSGLKNVYDVNSPKDDVMQSFFLAETLKYLYLTFSSDDFVSLNEWVFNTEGHPMPIAPTAPRPPAAASGP